MITPFSLHPRLARDSAHVCDLPLCRVQLMNDARFPWLILVPRRAGIAEFPDLDETDRTLLANEITRAGRILKLWCEPRVACDRLNIAMIGNIVPQLHAHIVARHRNDAVWPLPVWGHGEPKPYTDRSLASAVSGLSALFLHRD